MKAITIRVSGRVQGVFFRASAQDEAARRGLRGFVRNETDGSVYIEAEGSDAMILSFVEWCRHGPPRAQVVTFVMEESSPKGYVGFKIDRG